MASQSREPSPSVRDLVSREGVGKISKEGPHCFGADLASGKALLTAHRQHISL